MKQLDVIFVGGGLANGLAAFRLQQCCPDVSFIVLESGSSLGGNHTWSFHDSDIDAQSLIWITPFITRHWEAYDVKFPKLNRTLCSGYNSIRSDQFHRVVSSSLGERLRFGSKVVEVNTNKVVLADGKTFTAPLVVDGRGWEAPDGMALGYQKFVGLHIKTSEPHGLAQPTIMDATCEQLDGYRFFYVLPWSEDEVMIEDTRYSDTPDVEVSHYREEIEKYTRQFKWGIKEVLYEEVGSLPIPLNGQLPKWENGIVRTGVRAGLFHSTTGYSFPNAIQFAEQLANCRELSSKTIFHQFEKQAGRHWRRESFFRFLNRMLFWAAEPAERYRVLQRFYHLPEPLIQRFYSGRLALPDFARILVGKPPVPVLNALRCLSPVGRAA